MAAEINSGILYHKCLYIGSGIMDGSVRPHIIKRLDLWWCGERKENLIRHSVCHTSPKKAYELWAKQTRKGAMI